MLKQAFEDAAICFYANHGGDNGAEAWVNASGPTWLYTTDPGGGNPQVLWVSGPGGLENPTQCHLAVFYSCDAGWRFSEVLSPQGVDCVVGVRPGEPLWGDPVSATWTQAFWQHLRKGGYVRDALAVAPNEVKNQHEQFWNTDDIEAFGGPEVIVYARYQ